MPAKVRIATLRHRHSKQMINDDIYKALGRVAESYLLNASKDDLVKVVLAVWHEGFVPDTAWAETLDSKSQCVVGYILEFLAGFNVLCSEERESLLSVSESLKPSNPAYVYPDYYSDYRRDELATEWGLEHDLTPYFEYLSHFQTRHYQHSPDYKRPSPNFVL